MLNIFKNLFSKKSKGKNKEVKSITSSSGLINGDEDREVDEYLQPILDNLNEILEFNSETNEEVNQDFTIDINPYIPKLQDLIDRFYKYGSVYKPDTIEAIDQILSLYKSLLIDDRSQDKDKIKYIETIFPKIHKAFENIYYETLGAATYMNEKDVIEFRDSLF